MILIDRLAGLIPFWLIIPFVVKLSSCLTLPIEIEGDVAKKNRAIERDQVALIVNYLNKGLPHTALKELRPTLIEKPHHFDLNNLMGITQLALKNPEKAGRYFLRAAEIKPSVSVLLNLSSAYLQAKKNVKAIRLLKKLINSKEFTKYLYPERVYHNLGLAFEGMENDTEAEKYYLIATSENPVFYQTLMKLARFYRHKNPLKSLEYLEKSQMTCTHCWDPIYLLSQTLYRRNKAEEAEKYLLKFLEQKNISEANRSKALKQLSIVQSFQPRRQRLKKY